MLTRIILTCNTDLSSDNIVSPSIQRYFSRIPVPSDLRSSYHAGEIKKSLGKISESRAIVIAGQLAPYTLNEFDRVKAVCSMGKDTIELTTICRGGEMIVIATKPTNILSSKTINEQFTAPQVSST